VLAPLLAAGLGGCATTVTLPAEAADPVEVFLIDQGRTASIVIPSSFGGLLRYAYGDWRWYALRETGLWRALVTLFWPTQGALGRGELEGPATLANVRARLARAERVHSLRIGRGRVEAFERQMEALYDSRRETEVESPTTGLRFVHDPRRYTYFHNSNHVVAGWLRELGCTTRGASFHSAWRIEPALPSVRDSG
jgi:hypothetical protein